MATFSVACRNAAVDAVTALLDAGTSRASVVVRDAGLVLLYNSFPRAAEPQWAAASGGVASLTGTATFSAASNTGIATSWSLQSNGPGINVFVGGTVGLPGSGAEIEFQNTNIRAGQLMRYLTFDIAML